MIAATWQGMVTMIELATHDERPKRINGFEMRVEILADERNEPPRNNMMTDVEVAAQVDRADCFIEQRRRE